MGTVYVSSTFQDLIDARKAVWRAVQDLRHQPVGMETYGADEKTVIERCSDDVATSSAYVLIVGWRYGWQPPDEGGKSITEIEWEAAKRAGVRRFVYVQDDDTEPPARMFGAKDRKLVRAFRAKLRTPPEPMAGRFATVDELERRVLADLGPALGQPLEFPPEQRLTCDRQAQVVALQQAWVTGVRGRPPQRGPIVVLAYGEPEQGYDRYAQRLAKLVLATLPRKAAGKVTLPDPVRLDWTDAPDAARFVEGMHFALWSHLSSLESGRPVWSREEFVQASPPLVVGIEVPSDGWTKRLERVEAYAASWFEPPLDGVEVPTVVLLYVRAAKKAVASSLVALAEKLSERGLSVLALEFHSIAEPEALTWARSEKVFEFCKQRDAAAEIAQVFEKKPRWEMEPLMKKLEVIACKIAESTGGSR